MDDEAFVSSLPDMAAGFVVGMVAADVAGHEPLHVLVEFITMLRLYEHMKMVRHQTPCMQSNRVFEPCLLHQPQKGSIVFILMKYLLPAVTAIDDVVIAVVTQRSCYSRHVTAPLVGTQ